MTAYVSAVALARPSPSDERRAREIGAQAYIYGLALLEEQRVIVNFPANLLINVTELSTPAEKLVRLPNVDTLYTVARLELRDRPFVLHVPEMHGRYYTLQLIDAYTNTFGYIGRRVTGTHPGNFAIVAPGWRGVLPAGVRRVQSPTPTVWVLGRTLVRSAADLTNAQRVQRQYTLTPLNGFGGSPRAALFLTKSALRPAPLPTGLAFYDAMDAAMQRNPPPRADAPLLRRMASVGLGPGRSPSSERLSLATRRGVEAGLILGGQLLDRYATRLKVASERSHNGWLVPPKDTGDYGTDYLLRAYVASTATASNVPAEAVYPQTSVDDMLAPLSGRDRYLLHFAAGRLPPVNAFWSLTMYDKGLFLVPNPIDRYAIGDRTAGLRRNRDGSLDILLQHAVPRRDGSNWLPAPAGRFILALRLYQPKNSVLHGSWPLPKITRLGRR